MYFNGRLRQGARLLWHSEYGACIPAMIKSARALDAMRLSEEEYAKVKAIVAWMELQVLEKGRWF